MRDKHSKNNDETSMKYSISQIFYNQSRSDIHLFKLKF